MRAGPTRRGGTAAQLLVGLVMVGTIAVAAAVLVPRATVAQGEPTGVPARIAEHQEIIDLIGKLVRSSHRVLVVQPRGSTPFAEILLWLRDVDAPGMVDLPEIGLLSHSEVTQAVTLRMLHSVEPSVWRPAAAAWFPPAEIKDRLAWPAAACAEGAWCDRFRAFDYLDVKTLALGVSDMGLWWSEATEGGSARLQISLTWTANTADESDQASVTFSVPASPLRGEE